MAEQYIVKGGMPSLDKLSRAGQLMDHGGLTKAGRALDKHEGRPVTVFPKVIGNPVGVSRQSVYNWIKRHSASGKRALRICKQGRPKGAQLQPWQSAQVVNFIKISCPDELSMPFYLWTRESVGLLLQDKLNIKLSKWTVGRYLTN